MTGGTSRYSLSLPVMEHIAPHLIAHLGGLSYTPFPGFLKNYFDCFGLFDVAQTSPPGNLPPVKELQPYNFRLSIYILKLAQEKLAFLLLLCYHNKVNFKI